MLILCLSYFITTVQIINSVQNCINYYLCKRYKFFDLKYMHSTTSISFRPFSKGFFLTNYLMNYSETKVSGSFFGKKMLAANNLKAGWRAALQIENRWSQACAPRRMPRTAWRLPMRQWQHGCRAATTGSSGEKPPNIREIDEIFLVCFFCF